VAHLSRYTHRVAIANSRFIAFNVSGATFKWKNYRAGQRQRAKVMTLAVDEFTRGLPTHMLPSGFHRIRHYGLFANGGRAENIARARQFAQCSGDATASPRHRRRGRRRGAIILVSLTMFRRKNDRHRNIRAWSRTTAWPIATDPDRQLMTDATSLSCPIPPTSAVGPRTGNPRVAPASMVPPCLVHSARSAWVANRFRLLGSHATQPLVPAALDCKHTVPQQP